MRSIRVPDKVPRILHAKPGDALRLTIAQGGIHLAVGFDRADLRGTLKQDGVAMGRIGIFGLVASLVVLVLLVAMGEGVDDAGMALIFALMGATALATNALRLPRWASEREEQMEHIAARARTLIRADSTPNALGEGS